MGKKRKKCGELLPYAFSRQFGKKETIRLLKMRGVWSKGLNFLSFVTFRFGLRCI